jgi:hypothetical protein
LELLEEVKAKDERERHRSASKKVNWQQVFDMDIQRERLFEYGSAEGKSSRRHRQCSLLMPQYAGYMWQQRLLMLYSDYDSVCCLQAREGNVRMKTGKGGLAQREALLDSHKHRKQSRKRVNKSHTDMCIGWTHECFCIRWIPAQSTQGVMVADDDDIMSVQANQTFQQAVSDQLNENLDHELWSTIISILAVRQLAGARWMVSLHCL